MKIADIIHWKFTLFFKEKSLNLKIFMYDMRKKDFVLFKHLIQGLRQGFIVLKCKNNYA